MSKYHSNKTPPFFPLLVLFALAIGFVVFIVSSITEFLSDNMWVLVAFLFFAITILIVVIVAKITQYRYIELITRQSPAIQALENLNSQYKFEHIPNSDMSNNYDNDNFFNDISPLDYLTYQLVYKQKQVCDNINAARKNNQLYPTYCQEVEALSAQLENYLPEDILFKNAFKKIHKRIFNNLIQSPITEFRISVTLCLTNINGVYLFSKKQMFHANEIEDIIKRLRHKQNDFYLDNEIWQSICRVERGKITNKIRFAIYARDGHRCLKCGSKTNLEIDHIFPIAKGGKSTYDNLQTLCHRCNALKSDSVTADAISHYAQTHNNAKNICPQCKRGLLVIRNGKNGKFYGCNNYPNCRFTKNL